MRFTLAWSDLVWAEPPCGIWLQDCTTNTQQDEPVNYSLLSNYPAVPSVHRTDTYCTMKCASVYLCIMSMQLCSHNPSLSRADRIDCRKGVWVKPMYWLLVKNLILYLCTEVTEGMDLVPSIYSQMYPHRTQVTLHRHS